MRALPNISELGKLRDQKSVLLTIAGYAFMRQCASLLSPLNLTPSRAIALAFIDSHPGADQTSFGRAMGMNRGSAMQLVDNLEKTRLVRRDPGADRRSNALRLTAEGHTALEGALKVDEVILKTVFSGLSEKDWRVIFKLMHAIFDADVEDIATDADGPSSRTTKI
jgi:DNA-binding MarR family transcriptional regulator